MIIDVHTHIYPDTLAVRALASLKAACGEDPHTDGTLKGLLRSMDESGVTLSVVAPIATKPSQVKTINDFSLSLRESDRIIPFGTVHPLFEGWRGELRRLSDAGLRGIKMHPDYQGFFVDDPIFVEIVNECSRLGLRVIIHGGLDVAFPGEHHCTPERVVRILPEIDSATLCLAHFGGFGYLQDVLDMLCGRDIYFDTSLSCFLAAGEEGARACAEIIKTHRPDRLLLGSDSPWDTQRGAADYIRSLGLDDELFDRIMSKNAAEYLSFDRRSPA